MSLIDVKNLTFSYEGSYDDIFTDVSFQLDTRWKLGFIGRNGRGKTTFLKLLMGLYPYQGQITSQVEFTYFPPEVADPDRLSGALVDEIYPGGELWRFQKELSLLGVELEVLDRPFSSLSYGERTKLFLAALFSGENRFLLIDEPTNHLDTAGRQMVSDYLAQKEGFILVSHDRVFLDRCVDHILSINRADIELMRGNFSTWWEEKTRRDQAEIEENARLKSEMKRLSVSSKRASGWSDKTEKTKKGAADSGFVGHKAAKMMKRAKNIEARRDQALQKTEGLLKNIEETETLSLKPMRYHSEVLVFAQDVTVFYGQTPVVGPVRFTVARGERVALQGKNGSGKTTLLKLAAGIDLAVEGQFHRGSGLVVSTVAQDSSYLTGDLTEFARQNGLDQTLFKAILRKLDFDRVQFEKDMKDYSAGQKKKVLLAKSLCEPAHLYLWDEPLNFIDLFSRMQVEELILQSGATMLFVEHDEAFVHKVATKIIRLP